MSLLALGTALSFGQGQIDVYSVGSSAYYISTNNASGNNTQAGTGTGVIASTANGYYFALLYSATPLADVPTLAGWTVAANFTGTNYNLGAGAIRFTGGAGGSAVSTIPLNPGPSYSSGTPWYYMLIGWSSTLGGSGAASTILTEDAASAWLVNGYFGYSPVGENVSGNPAASLPAVNMFGNTTGITGYGLPAGFQLDSVIPVPEPGTLALAALGGASLLMFRRKNK